MKFNYPLLQPNERINFKLRFLNKSKIIIFSTSIVLLIIIILLIGYLKFDWFQYKQDNIIQNIYNPNQVILFNEKKFINISIISENKTEKINELFFHDFLVVINSKKKLNYFGTIDYLYNATIIILKSRMDDLDIIGLNYSNNYNELTEEYLLNPNNSIIGKFSFYENGTLGEISFKENTTDFYGSLIIDLIEQIIPRISKLYYNNNTQNANIEFKYEEDNKNGTSEKKLTENHLERMFYDKYSNISFKSSKTSKIIKRTIYNETIEKVFSDSRLKLITENKTNNNSDNYIDLGLDIYNIRIISYLNLQLKKMDKKLNKLINSITKKSKFIESNNSFNITNKKDNYSYEGPENNYKNFKNEAKNSDSKSKLRNLKFIDIQEEDEKINIIFNLADFDIFDMHFGFMSVLFLSAEGGKCGFSVNGVINKKNYKILSKELNFLKKNFGNSYGKDFDIPFFFIIPLNLKVKIGVNYGITFQLDSKTKNKTSILVQPDINGYIAGILHTNYPVVNIGVEVTGNVLGLKSNLIINLGKTSNIFGYFYRYYGASIGIFFELKYLPSGHFLFWKWKEKKLNYTKTINIKKYEKNHTIFSPLNYTLFSLE